MSEDILSARWLSFLRAVSRQMAMLAFCHVRAKTGIAANSVDQKWSLHES
jgi:hypothetical protein